MYSNKAVKYKQNKEILKTKRSSINKTEKSNQH